MREYNYDWRLNTAKFTKDKGTVFSCFSCGGGSTMGYKLAGFDVIGCNEIDHRMMYAYCQNHIPKYPFLQPIQEFKDLPSLPKELFELDILDGSPPCSSFSMAGNREKDWGKEKKFREGQQVQVLDTLFFDFLDLAKRLQPKAVVAENVEGLLLGNAVSYVKEIYNKFEDAGYSCQHWLLDSSKMGVPQQRKRVFFIGLRKDIAAPLMRSINFFEQKPLLDLDFNISPIPFSEIKSSHIDNPVGGEVLRVLGNAKYGETDLRYANERLKGKQSLFGYRLLYDKNIVSSIIASGHRQIVFKEKRFLNDDEYIKAGSFPSDYNFCGNPIPYLIGMSVPPVMMAHIATRIWEYWLNKL